MSVTVNDPLPSSRSPVNAGDLLDGKYRVKGVIGQGGMGMVVEAWHDVLEQPVAIKLLTSQARRSHQGVKRFLAEARSAAKVTSVHGVRVLDVGTLDDGVPFIVMEFLAGKNLGDVLRDRGPLPVGETVDYVLQACDAIADAHSIGIIHRDLKPENLFLATQRDGISLVKVLDFGIAKALGGDDELTLAGHMMGTPQYMAPEQLRNASDVDARTDIWAMGVILYRLLTARYPFAGKGTDLLDQIEHRPVRPPSGWRADLPPGLEAVILRCLEKERLARFRHIGELAHALAPFAVEPSAERLARIRRLIDPTAPTPPPAAAPSNRRVQVAFATTQRSAPESIGSLPTEAAESPPVPPPITPEWSDADGATQKYTAPVVSPSVPVTVPANVPASISASFPATSGGPSSGDHGSANAPLVIPTTNRTLPVLAFLLALAVSFVAIVAVTKARGKNAGPPPADSSASLAAVDTSSSPSPNPSSVPEDDATRSPGIASAPPPSSVPDVVASTGPAPRPSPRPRPTSSAKGIHLDERH